MGLFLRKKTRALVLVAVQAAAVWSVGPAAGGPLDAQVDPSGRWLTLRTSHFHVHHRVERAEQAAHVAREAERAYGLLSEELQPPRGTIDIALHDNVDFSNGAATVFPTNRLIIYLAPPGSDPVLGSFDDWMRLLLTHELTHLFHVDRTMGIWTVVQAVFGRASWAFPNSYRSSWVKEGLATYYESRLTNAGRVRGGFHGQLLTASAGAGAWPRSEDATLASPAWPSGSRAYAWGSRFFAQQAAVFGDSVIPAFVEHSSGRLWPLTVAGPLEQAGGERVTDGWTRLREASTPTSAVTPDELLARGLRARPRLALSSDGRTLAFVHNDGRDVPRVVLRDLATLRETSHRATSRVGLGWVGETLYISQLDFRSAVDVRSGLHEWGKDASWKRVPAAERVSEPFAWRSGGVGVLVLDGLSRVPSFIDAEGNLTTAVSVPPADDWATVTASPTGSHLVGARHLDGRWQVIYWPTNDRDGAEVVETGDYWVGDPAWSVDGTTVLYTSERSGVPQIHAFSVEDGTITQRTDVVSGASEPQVTPDGRLFFTTVLEDGYAIATIPHEQLLLRNLEPAAPRAAFTEAPAVESEESGYNPWPTLAPRYWNPLFRSEGDAGTFFGALTSASDAIGRTAYTVFAAVAPETERAEVGVSAFHQRWKGASLDLGLSQSWSGINVQTRSGAIVPLGEREREARAGITLSRRWWRSGLALRTGGDLSQTAYFDDRSGDSLFTTPTFAGATISGTAFYRMRPNLAISSENGLSVNALVRRRWALTDSSWSYEVRGGASGYLAIDLPGFAHWALAGRVAAGRTGGPAAGFLSIGGESGDPLQLAPGFSVGMGRNSFPMRAYPRTSGFTRVASSAVELRVPVALVAEGIWILPIILDRVSVTGFFEAGDGWNEGESGSLSRLQGAGAEAVTDLGVLYDTPLRVRVGWAVPLRDGLGVSRGESRTYLTFGASF